MIPPQIALLPSGKLHLQHGPIDLICRAWGEADEVSMAYAQAVEAFEPVLMNLAMELPLLRVVPGQPPHGPVARAMYAACLPYAAHRVTCMAAVAGAVADHVLAAMRRDRTLSRGFVNNGGDIAFHLAPGEELSCGLVSKLEAPALDGFFRMRAENPARGIATSGRACKDRGGKSFSFGIADSVSVLARTTAAADAAATVIANAVDLPGHPAIVRRPATEIDPNNELGSRQVTWDVGELSVDEAMAALNAGLRQAERIRRVGLIEGAVLVLGDRAVQCAAPPHPLEAA